MKRWSRSRSLNAASTLLLASVLTACTSEAPPPAAQANADAERSGAGGGRITGTVTLDGSPPSRETIRLDADPQCAALVDGAPVVDQSVSVGEGDGLENVFVYLKQGVTAGARVATPEALVLDQQQCQYVPRVLGLQVGQTLIIRNSDPLLHTVRADARVNARFNVATPRQGIEIKRSWSKSEVMVPVGCDMHPWMHAYVGVLDHPYFSVTDSAGRFSIHDVPPGRYTIEVWHERFGTQTQIATVGAADARDLRFVFTTQ
jgi:hypothetical protein